MCLFFFWVYVFNTYQFFLPVLKLFCVETKDLVLFESRSLNDHGKFLRLQWVTVMNCVSPCGGACSFCPREDTFLPKRETAQRRQRQAYEFKNSLINRIRSRAVSKATEKCCLIRNKKQINKKVILFAYQWKHKLKDFELLKIFSKFAWRQLYSHQGLLWQRLQAYFQIILIKQMRNNTPTHSVLHIIKWDFCKKLIFPPPHTASVVVSKLSPGDTSC